MDPVLQNFRRSFGPTTPFFQSLSLDPPAIMEELYRGADKYSTLENNIRAASETVMITAQSGKPTTKSQPNYKESARAERKPGKEPKAYPRAVRKEKRSSPMHTPPPPPPLTSPTTDCFPSSGITPSLSGLHPSGRTRTNVTGHSGVTTTGTTTMKRINAKA